jgi:hypothetical protein
MPHKSNFFFSQFANLIHPLQREAKIMKTPQNKRFHVNLKKCLSLWPTYIGEKGRTLGKTYGIKVSAIGNTLGQHIWNLGNILRTWLNQLLIEHEWLFKWLKIVLLHKFIFSWSSSQRLSILEFATLIYCIFCNCYNNGSFLKFWLIIRCFENL